MKNNLPIVKGMRIITQDKLPVIVKHIDDGWILLSASSMWWSETKVRELISNSIGCDYMDCDRPTPPIMGGVWFLRGGKKFNIEPMSKYGVYCSYDDGDLYESTFWEVDDIIRYAVEYGWGYNNNINNKLPTPHVYSYNPIPCALPYCSAAVSKKGDYCSRKCNQSAKELEANDLVDFLVKKHTDCRSSVKLNKSLTTTEKNVNVSFMTRVCRAVYNKIAEAVARISLFCVCLPIMLMVIYPLELFLFLSGKEDDE